MQPAHAMLGSAGRPASTDSAATMTQQRMTRPVWRRPVDDADDGAWAFFARQAMPRWRATGSSKVVPMYGRVPSDASVLYLWARDVRVCAVSCWLCSQPCQSTGPDTFRTENN